MSKRVGACCPDLLGRKRDGCIPNASPKIHSASLAVHWGPWTVDPPAHPGAQRRRYIVLLPGWNGGGSRSCTAGVVTRAGGTDLAWRRQAPPKCGPPTGRPPRITPRKACICHPWAMLTSPPDDDAPAITPCCRGSRGYNPSASRVSGWNLSCAKVARVPITPPYPPPTSPVHLLIAPALPRPYLGPEPGPPGYHLLPTRA